MADKEAGNDDADHSAVSQTQEQSHLNRFLANLAQKLRAYSVNIHHQPAFIFCAEIIPIFKLRETRKDMRGSRQPRLLRQSRTVWHPEHILCVAINSFERSSCGGNHGFQIVSPLFFHLLFWIAR